MSSSFQIALDTTAPALSVSGKRDIGDPSLVLLDIQFGDAEELRIWGDIDPLGPENGQYAEKEEDAPWIGAESPLLVRLSTAPEPRLHISARDDVWNTVTVIEVFPAAVAPPPPAPPSSGGVPRSAAPPPRFLARSAELRITSRRRSMAARGSSTRRGTLRVHHEHRRRAAPEDRLLSREHSVHLGRRTVLAAAWGRSIRLDHGSRRSIRRSEQGDDDMAVVMALDLF